MSSQTVRVDGATGGRGDGWASAVEDAARRQIVFREVNENIARLTGPTTEIGYCLFICECSDTSCVASLEIAPAEYEEVRTDATRFVVAPGHEQEETERVVARNGRFLVVEKLGRAVGTV